MGLDKKLDAFSLFSAFLPTYDTSPILPAKYRKFYLLERGTYRRDLKREEKRKKERKSEQRSAPLEGSCVGDFPPSPLFNLSVDFLIWLSTELT